MKKKLIPTPRLFKYHPCPHHGIVPTSFCFASATAASAAGGTGASVAGSGARLFLALRFKKPRAQFGMAKLVYIWFMQRWCMADISDSCWGLSCKWSASPCTDGELIVVRFKFKYWYARIPVDVLQTINVGRLHAHVSCYDDPVLIGQAFLSSNMYSSLPCRCYQPVKTIFLYPDVVIPTFTI